MVSRDRPGEGRLRTKHPGYPRSLVVSKLATVRAFRCECGVDQRPCRARATAPAISGRLTALSTPSRHTRRSEAVIQIDLDERNEANQRRRGSGPFRPSDHSMTWSDRNKTDCGIVMPSSRAVLRFTASPNLLNISTGRLRGLVPARTRWTYFAKRRPASW